MLGGYKKCAINYIQVLKKLSLKGMGISRKKLKCTGLKGANMNKEWYCIEINSLLCWKNKC